MSTLRSWIFGGILIASLPVLGAGCAATDAAEESDGDDGTSQDAISESTTERQAILGGLRSRVQRDFANVVSLRGMKLVFVVERLQSSGSKAAVRGKIWKRSVAGRDSELTDADFRGSAFESAIKDGVFDGPGIFALLEKTNGKWAVMKKGEGEDALEAYAVGPTDVPWGEWDAEFGVPREWLGFQQ